MEHCLKSMEVSHKEMFEEFLLLPIDEPLGPIKAPVWALKGSLHIINPILTTIINECISKAEFLQGLKKGHVNPVFKKRETANPINNRPISITPVVSELFEKYFSAEINHFLFDNNILSRKQFSFRHNYSINDALLYTTEKNRYHFNKHIVAAAAF